jgi:hypothetical protein
VVDVGCCCCMLWWMFDGEGGDGRRWLDLSVSYSIDVLG